MKSMTAYAEFVRPLEQATAAQFAQCEQQGIGLESADASGALSTGNRVKGRCARSRGPWKIGSQH